MQKQLSFMFLLLGTLAVFTACSSGSETSVNVQPPELNQVWTAKVLAENSDIEVIEESSENGEDETRALFVGGNDGNRFAKCWDDGDKVYVYKAGATSSSGFLTPASADWGFASATLSGTLEGSFSVDEELALYLPSKAMDFTGQTGQLKSVSEKAYRQTTTTVAQAAENNLALSDVRMNSRTTFARFYLTEETTGERLHPSQLVIHAVSGPDPVLKVDENGEITERGDFVIEGELYEGEYPGEIYVSWYKETEEFNYRLQATVGEDIYVGPISGQNPIRSQDAIGGLMNYLRKMRKTTPATSLVVADIADKTFTGSPITPAVTVQDGTTTLTQGTDYSVSYADNVAAGTATVTVTGLADAGAVAATKYLGTKVKTFNIVKATPVITMETGDVELVNTATGGHVVTAVTIADGSVDLKAAPHSCSISYESSDPSVATVDAATGVVTGVSSGTCTITAKVAGTGNWNEATSQYTVRVSTSADATNTIRTWGNGGSEDDTIKL